MKRALIFVGKSYLYVVGALILISYIWIWYSEGFAALADILSPFNLLNWVAVLIALAPGLGLLWLGERLKRKGEVV